MSWTFRSQARMTLVFVYGLGVLGVALVVGGIVGALFWPR